MNPYQFIADKEQHSLETVFEKFKVSNERQFCRKFFTKTEVEKLFPLIGFELPGEILEIIPDKSIKFGDGYLIPDILVIFENETWYLEVMSSTNGGLWDNEHHKQLYIKRERLSQEYGSIKSFAVAFKEFSPCYLEEFCSMPDTYAIQLVFGDEGYRCNVVCQERKRLEDSGRRNLQLDFWAEFINKFDLLKDKKPQKSDWMAKFVNNICIGVQSNGVKTSAYLSFKEKMFDSYYKLLEKKELIEDDFGDVLIWRETPKFREIRFESGPCINDKEKWEQGQKFLYENAKKLEKILEKYF
jgi:hypothetical protein